MPAESVSCSVMSDSLQPHVAHQIHGILQARILEWVAIPFTRGSFQLMDQTWVSHAVGRFFYHLGHQGSLDLKLKPLRLIWFSRGLPKEGAKDAVLYRTGATPKESPEKESFPQRAGNNWKDISCKWGAAHISVQPCSWEPYPIVGLLHRKELTVFTLWQEKSQDKLPGYKMRQTGKQELTNRRKWKSLSCVWLFRTPWTIQDYSPGQNTRVGSHSLLQEIFLTQGSNPHL